MRPLRELDRSLPLTLAKPSWKRGLHELRAGTEVVGTLDVNSWSGGSVAAAAEGGWRFERPRGFLRRSVRILGAGDVELGRFASSGFGGRGGTLRLGERVYELRTREVFKPRFAWTDGSGELAAFTASGGLGERKGAFELTAAGRASADAALLLLLGAHLALLSQRETAAIGGASAAAAGAAAAGS